MRGPGCSDEHAAFDSSVHAEYTEINTGGGEGGKVERGRGKWSGFITILTPWERILVRIKKIYEK